VSLGLAITSLKSFGPSGVRPWIFDLKSTTGLFAHEKSTAFRLDLEPKTSARPRTVRCILTKWTSTGSFAKSPTRTWSWKPEREKSTLCRERTADLGIRHGGSVFSTRTGFLAGHNPHPPATDPLPQPLVRPNLPTTRWRAEPHKRMRPSQPLTISPQSTYPYALAS
jgi:hypothetical protein